MQPAQGCTSCTVPSPPVGCLTKESGACLKALPITSLGLRMDDDTIRVAVGLRLGTTLCRPHACHHCGSEVDCLGIHGLRCTHSEGHRARHAAINGIVHRTLTAAHVPSRLEPAGISHCKASNQMVSQQPPGRVVSFWYGTRPVLTQCLSVAVQQGNRALVLRSARGHSPDIDTDYY